MKVRLIIIPIDDICRIFKDYANLTGFPNDAKCDTLLFNRELMKMCLRIEAESLDGYQAPEEINFELKQSWVA